MERGDFESIAAVGQALWPDASVAAKACRDTVAAVSLLELSDERSTERIARALLDQSVDWRPAAAALNHPFYRLLPLERLTLTALHAAKWSYGRLSRITGLTSQEIQDLVWRTRQILASQHPRARVQRSPLSVETATMTKHHCPEVVSTRPWTQAFLDDEMPSRERLFLQNHLMVCRACHEQLSRTRDIYFLVDEMIPRSRDRATLERDLERTWSLNLAYVRPGERTFLQSVRVFLGRGEARAAIVAMLLILAAAILR